MAETRQDLVHRHERSDVAARWPVMVGVGFLLLLPLTVALVALLMNTLWYEAPSQPDMFANEPRIVDAPQLLVHPTARLAELRAQWRGRLSSYGWVDREAGIVHIPISVAMQRLAMQTQAGEKPPPQALSGSGKNGQPDDATRQQQREPSHG